MNALPKFFNLLIILAIALVLAGSLNHLELLPGETSASQNQTYKTETPSSSPFQDHSSGIDPPFWVLYLFLIPLFYSGFKLLSKLTWDPIKDKGWQSYLLLLAIITALIFLLSLLIGFLDHTITNLLPGSGFRVPKLIQVSLLKNRIPLWVGFSAVLLLASLGVLQILKRLPRQDSQTDLIKLQKLVSREISKTADRISAGGGARKTIIHCYQTMCSLLNRYVSQERADSSTAKEFSDQLEQIGLRDVHIALLTQLFEKARYSDAVFTMDETHQAISCLKEIAQQYQEEDAI